jgi:hypothetical protein
VQRVVDADVLVGKGNRIPFFRRKWLSVYFNEIRFKVQGARFKV